MDTLNKYIHLFSTLHRNRNPKHGMAPHKPILLLAVLDEIERGHISHGFISLTPELITAFSERWRALVTPNTWGENIAMPFRYMAHEDFWDLIKDGVVIPPQMLDSSPTVNQLRKDVDGAILPIEFWSILQDKHIVKTLQELLLKKYFSMPRLDNPIPHEGSTTNGYELEVSDTNAKPPVDILQDIHPRNKIAIGVTHMVQISLADFENLPPKISLEHAFLLLPNAQKPFHTVPLEALGLSFRPSRCLAQRGIVMLDQLVSLTLEDLYEIPAMGRTSVLEVISRILEYCKKNGNTFRLRYVPDKPVVNVTIPTTHKISKDDWVPLTLRHEWNLFSWNADTRLPMALLHLSREVYEILSLEANGDIDQLLVWSWNDVCNLLGEDIADEVLQEIVVLAQECRIVRGDLAPLHPLSMQEQRTCLENRWANGRISKDEIQERTITLLRKSSIRTLSQLLESLSPLHPVLQLDITAFIDVWNFLVSIGLRDGDAFETWQSKIAEHSSPISLDDVVAEICQSCTARQWDVLNMRFGLMVSEVDTESSNDHTLEEVALGMGLTRERVRQIEWNALQQHGGGKLQEALTASLVYLIDAAGGVMSVWELAEAVTEYIPPGAVNAVALCRLFLEMSSDAVAVQRGSIYCVKRLPSDRYSLALQRANKVVRSSLVALSDDEICKQVHESLEQEGYAISLDTVVACIRASGRFLAGYQPRDLTYHLVETLKSIGHPAHFTEITARLNASGWRRNPTSTNSVGSRLGSERELFVYVDKGTYGLAEWGSEDKRVFDRRKNGLIGDIIEELLTERDEPVDTSEIIEAVLSRKRCQEFSVLQRLSMDDRFHAFGRGKYGLKNGSCEGARLSSVINLQLFSAVYLRELQAGKHPADTLEGARQTIRDWREEYPTLNQTSARTEYVRQCLSALGISSSIRAKKDGFTLFSDSAKAEATGLCLVTEELDLGRMVKGGHPQARLVRELRKASLRWGILTNGIHWRLCCANASAPYETFLQANLDEILTAPNLLEFLVFHRFFGGEAFSLTDNKLGLTRFLTESDKRTEAIERHLKSQVEPILQKLCLGFVQDEAASDYSAESLQVIYQNAIYLLYRILFLFYAEARGLLPIESEAYQPFGLAGMVKTARQYQEGATESDAFPLWKRLTRLFVVVDDGDEQLGCGVQRWSF